MNNFPNVAHWLEIWCRELALLQWSNTEGEAGLHSIFGLTAAMQIKPLVSVSEEYDDFMSVALTKKEHTSDFVSELMELTMRITAAINLDELHKEFETLIKGLNSNFEQLGGISYEEMNPLKTFVLLHRIYSVEISARIKAYEPIRHNPVLGYFTPLLEELLIGAAKETKGA
ncbi:hypothetical protein [Vibrio phage VP4B]|uniref:Uncharacterized protein n=1 Tax=Vibrio phage VP4B TaxID=1262540 RepID=V9LZK9_9CAUD|nr:hypothetical protein FDJ61_gp006 [Vibrio phage VP4B]AGB07120.1 hypothetical protein [Vibrio phage VP4B]